jgi:regulator of replication initiation timing
MDNKIVEALKKLLPESEINEVAGSVEKMLEQAKATLEKEYNEKLEEAYSELSNELAEAEKTAEKGYEEAYAIIADLRNRLEVQGEEYNAQLQEGYEEAYQMLKAEREKNNQLEVEMYEEYDKKLQEMKDYIVDKVDQFLQFKGQEIYEQARREVLNDPRMAEHKVALDKIVEVTSSYLTDADFNVVTSSKLEAVSKQMEEMKGQLKIMEARNIRLSTENTKLNEWKRQAEAVITEATKTTAEDKKAKVITEQKEKIEKAKNATGRGHVAEDTEVIAEYNTGSSEMDQLLVLSGLKTQ